MSGAPALKLRPERNVRNLRHGIFYRSCVAARGDASRARFPDDGTLRGIPRIACSLLRVSLKSAPTSRDERPVGERARAGVATQRSRTGGARGREVAVGERGAQP